MDNFMDKIAQKLGAQEAIRANAAADAAQIERLEAQVAEYDACIKEMRKLNLRNTENEQKMKEMLKSTSGKLHEAIDQGRAENTKLVEDGRRQIGQLVEDGQAQVQQLVGECQAQMQQFMEESRQQAQQLAEESRRQAQLLAEKNRVQAQQMAEESQRRLEQITGVCMEKLQRTDADSQMTREKAEEFQALLEELKEASKENMTKIAEMFHQADDFVHKENVKVYRNVQAATAEELQNKTQTVMDSQRSIADRSKGILTVSILTLVMAAVNLGVLIAHLVGMF